MSIELVYRPEVELVAHSTIVYDGLTNWVIANNLQDNFNDSTTPIGRLRTEIEEGQVICLDSLPEFAGRFCYRSFTKGRNRFDYLRNIIESGHGSVLEHAVVSFAISGVSRSLTHELIRHRAGNSPSQESQRYVDSRNIRFVIPPLILQHDALIEQFRADCEHQLQVYTRWQGYLSTNTVRKRYMEAARAVLPNAAETRLIWTMNMRSARFLCALRGSEAADLEIRRLACELTTQLKRYAPYIFHDFTIYDADDGFKAVRCEDSKV